MGVRVVVCSPPSAFAVLATGGHLSACRCRPTGRETEDARGGADFLGTRTAHAKDVRESDDDVLVHRDVDAGNTCHYMLSE